MDPSRSTEEETPRKRGSEEDGPRPSKAEPGGTGRTGSVLDGTAPLHAESNRTVPQGTEAQASELPWEREELYTTTIREAVKLFEAAGVPRAERTLVKWCSRDATGIGRLDCQYDSNDRKYYITEESISRVIAEEQQKANRKPAVEQTVDSEKGAAPVELPHTKEVRELELKLRDLEISNRAKDHVIDRYEKEREAMLNQLTAASQKVGSLETELRRLEEPTE